MADTAVEGRSSPPRRVGDRVFKGLATGAALVILAALAGVAIFLTYEGVPAFTAAENEIPGGSGIIAYI
ncbi:MAG: phosphate ABC transporter permease subunit PstC, partial [Propionibacteriales bacterium]|nr:phosphate ABC transporter permease subunit PstC [Propionibacteriales bacterium]